MQFYFGNYLDVKIIAFFGVNRAPFRIKPALPLNGTGKYVGLESPLMVILGQQEIVLAQDQRDSTFKVRLR